MGLWIVVNRGKRFGGRELMGVEVNFFEGDS